MSAAKQSNLFTYFQKSQDGSQNNITSANKPTEPVSAPQTEEAEREYLKHQNPFPSSAARPSRSALKPNPPETTSAPARRKRKLIDEDEDDDEDYQASCDDQEEDYEEDVADDLEDEYTDDKNRRKASRKTSQAKPKVPKSNNKTTAKKTGQNKDPQSEALADDNQLVPQPEGGKTALSIAKFDADGNPNYDMFDDPTPWWALPKDRLDAQKRKPDHPDYDPTTLYIPPEELKKLSPARKQFWLIKSKNMDKVIFFKLGKFYELFDQDAVIGVQQLGLAFMGNTMHAGVPEVALDKFADKLVQLGYKVAIVEQTETERERKSRMSTGPKGQDKVIQRDLIKVLTKGTYVSPLDDSPKLNSNYLWIFRSYADGYALCIVELSLNLCWLSYVPRDENFSKLKMLIYQLKPTEIVVDPSALAKDTLKIFSHISTAPLITKIHNADKLHFWNSMVMQETFAGSKFLAELERVVVQFPSEEHRSVVKSVFTGLVVYLNQLKILESYVDILSIRKYDDGMVLQQNMILDSQALEQLEIIEATHDFRTKRDDSLLHSLDRCVSLPGKRLLKSIVCAPFLDVNTINDRLDAIEDLHRHIFFLKDFHKHLAKLGDLERVLARLFKYSIKQKDRFVLFEDISTTRLRELKTVFHNLASLQDTILNSALTCKWTSRLMRSLTSVEEQGGLLKSNIKTEIHDIESNILWTGDNASVPVPRAGINKFYDQVKESIKEVQTELDAYLREQIADLKCHSLEFAHVKNRYEISVPEDKKVPSTYQFSSCRKGFKRYVTPTTIRLVDKLETREDQLKEHMKDFCLYIFDYFNKKRALWENLVNISKELDVLCSMCLYSFGSRGDFCRPKLFGPDVRPFIELRASRHPIVSVIQDEFTPNDVDLGSRSDDQIILLTGPNMGGKSTILRQVCLIAIIAQIGCYVPATSCEMTAVDRIFTRLGASDKLVEGKSTFFVEMEDIYNLVTFGTDRSLAIIDELGRGTSTTDGFSIAASILDHMLNKIGCLSIFSTHYHSLINFCLDYDAVSFWKMDFLIDDATQDIIFLHKLVPGICNRSFGIKIGRLAGIDETILHRAEAISREVDLQLNRSFRDDINRKFRLVERAIMDPTFDLSTLRDI